MNKITISENVMSADNQQERTRQSLDPWYIVGFVEGEGTFHVAFYVDPRMKRSIKVIPEFHVNQSYLRLSTLQEIKRYFACGYIKENHAGNERDTTHVYVVRNRADLLKKIIPFFGRYRLRSIKGESFALFAGIVTAMAEGKHRTVNGLRRIIHQAYRMNVGGTYRYRSKQTLLQVLSSSETIR